MRLLPCTALALVASGSTARWRHRRRKPWQASAQRRDVHGGLIGNKNGKTGLGSVSKDSVHCCSTHQDRHGVRLSGSPSLGNCCRSSQRIRTRTRLASLTRSAPARHHAAPFKGPLETLFCCLKSPTRLALLGATAACVRCNAGKMSAQLSACAKIVRDIPGRGDSPGRARQARPRHSLFPYFDDY
ncbi:hypothetical protein ABIB68_007842 [Bradyrhizobium sp. F1.2.2]